MTILVRRFGLAGMVAGLFLGPVVGTAAGAAERVADPGKFITVMADTAVQALTKPDIERAERVRRFRALLRANFAVEDIGQFVLGPYWKRATEAEKLEYLKLFEGLIVFTYVDRFAGYSGEKLTVVRTLGLQRGDSLVQSVIQNPKTDKGVNIGWRVTPADGGLKVIDVEVEGLSMRETQRSEFKSVVRRGGGKISVLIEALREKLKGNL